MAPDRRRARAFPELVGRHGAAGTLLFGQAQRGYYRGATGEDWELDHDAPGRDADLVRRMVRWRTGV